MWITVGTLIGAAAGAHQLYYHFIRPHRKQTKLLHACHLIEQWFDAIDETVEHGFDLPRIYNREDRVARYLEEHNLLLVPLTFDARFRRRFLRGCAPLVTREDPAVFERFARTSAKGTSLGSLWGELVRAFHDFRKKYEEKSDRANFAELEMRLRLLRMYFRVPAKKNE